LFGCLAAAAAVFGGFKAQRFLGDAIRTDRHVRRAALREPEAERAWRQEFGDPLVRLREVPRRQENETARRLAEMARPLGIELARPVPGQPVSHPSDAERSLREVVASYFQAELESPGDRIGPPPRALREFLVSREADIDGIVALLTGGGEPPVWVSVVSLGPEAPIPNLLGQVLLQKLLVADCLVQAQLERREEAERILLASWILNGSIRDRADVISQIIAVGVARMHLGAARRLILTGPWRERFRDHDYRQSLLRAMEIEASGRFQQLPNGSSRSERATRADFLDLTRIFLTRLRNAPVEDGPLPTEETRGEAGMDDSPGERLARIAMPNVVESVRRADRLTVDQELTERVLDARDTKSKLGRWPAETPGPVKSRMPGAEWITAIGKDGRMTISLSRELRWEDGGLVLPLCHVLD
jgi:hypothetical protein